MRENPNMSGIADRQTNVGRESNVGWHESVPPNGFAKRPRSAVTDTNDNPAGLAAEANELETTPEHYNLVAGDPTVSGWTRRYDDPNVVALRERLDRENGIPDLELVEPADVDRAVELFDRDGFVAVRDALDPSMLERMRMAVDRAVERLLEVDPDNSVGGGAGGLPHRYSFGSSSATRHMLHVPEWCELVDLATTTPILTAIFGSPSYLLGGGGGDMALPGAIEYQGRAGFGHKLQIFKSLNAEWLGQIMTLARSKQVSECIATSRDSLVTTPPTSRDKKPRNIGLIQDRGRVM